MLPGSFPLRSFNEAAPEPWGGAAEPPEPPAPGAAVGFALSWPPVLLPVSQPLGGCRPSRVLARRARCKAFICLLQLFQVLFLVKQ